MLYSNTKGTAASGNKKTNRHIPQVPERILDAPELVNDYYLNLLDWSSNNVLAVALGAHIYLWNASKYQCYFNIILLSLVNIGRQKRGSEIHGIQYATNQVIFITVYYHSSHLRDSAAFGTAGSRRLRLLRQVYEGGKPLGRGYGLIRRRRALGRGAGEEAEDDGGTHGEGRQSQLEPGNEKSYFEVGKDY